MINVPALSERTIRRDIMESGLTTRPEIQVSYVHVIQIHLNDSTVK